MASSEQHVKTLEDCVHRFHACPKARLRKRIVQGFFGLTGLLLLVALSPLGGLVSGLSILGIALVALCSYFVVSGSTENAHLFTKVRDLVLGCSFRDWLTAVGILLLFLVVLWLFGVLWLWLTVLAMAVAAAAAFHVLVDRPIARFHADPIARAQEILREMRSAGQDEAELQAFVARHGGPQWEEFFEALFGYDAKLAARRQWGFGEDGRQRKRFRAWRDPVIRWIDEKLRIRREAAQRRYFQAIAERSLRAEGVSPEEARRRAEDMAWAMVFRAAQPPGSSDAIRAPQAAQVPDQFKEAWESARKAAAERTGWLSAAGDAVYYVLAFLFGQRMRLLLGCVLLAGCALWAHQNGVLRRPETEDWEQIRQFGEELVAAVTEGSMSKLDQLAPERCADYQPLALPWMPSAVTGLFNSYNPGVAGVVLILSALIAGLKISIFLFPAVLVMLFAHTTGVPGLLEPAGNSITSLAIGLVLVLAGYIWGRE
jgi:hypothetical protein